MKRGWKIARRIILIVVAIYTALMASVVIFSCSSNNIYSSKLFFSYSGHRNKTKENISGSVQAIEISSYNKKDIIYSLKNASVFPDIITVGKANLFLYSDPIFEYSSYPRGEAYLEWETTEEEYAKEINRIMDIEGSGLSKNHPVWSFNLFPMPSLVATYNCEGVFEYAIFNEDLHTIIYVVLRDIGTTENIVFSHDYEPKKPIKESDLRKYAKNDRMYDIYSY